MISKVCTHKVVKRKSIKNQSHIRLRLTFIIFHISRIWELHICSTKILTLIEWHFHERITLKP